jgi:hypothetical protein
MFNPCPSPNSSSPGQSLAMAPSEPVVDTRPATTPAPEPRPITPSPALDALWRIGDSLEEILARLNGEGPDDRGDEAIAADLANAVRDLDQSLPAMAQRVVDLLSGTFPAIEKALCSQVQALKKSPPVPAPVKPMGGSFGGAAKAEGPSAPPGKTPAYRPLVGPQEPAAPFKAEPIPDSQIDLMAAPPTPPALGRVRREAIETPWTPAEGERYRQELAWVITEAEVLRAIVRLPELEAFCGGLLRKVSNQEMAGSFDPTDSVGFHQLAMQPGPNGRANATGAYLARLAHVYWDYKREYYGLTRARRHRAGRRAPGDWLPILSEDEIEAYLWERYGAALESLLWRLMRTLSKATRPLPTPRLDSPLDGV